MAWPCKSLLERWHAFAVETPSKHGPAACSNLPSQSTSALSFLKCDKRPPSWGGRCAWLSSSSTVDRDSIRRRARNSVARNNLARNKHRRQRHRGQQHRRLPLLQSRVQSSATVVTRPETTSSNHRRPRAIALTRRARPWRRRHLHNQYRPHRKTSRRPPPPRPPPPCRPS